MFDAWNPQFDALKQEPRQPKYEQLKKLLISELSTGRLRPGMELPSEQRLAESLRIARSTVRHALAELERDGLVSRFHGKGTYIHEEACQRLRKGRDLFALIMPDTQTGFCPALLRSFENAAARLHNQVIICNSNNEVQRQGNTILQLIDHSVAGVAIMPTTSPPTPAFQIRHLQKCGIPVVFCGRKVEGIRAPLLAIPFEEVGRRAGRMILEAGHRRVAYFALHRSQATLAYEDGLRKSFRAIGTRGVDLQVFYGTCPAPDMPAHEQEICEALDRICGRPERPTAIFASFDSLAELIYLLLSQRGLRVPDDVSLVGFGGTQRESAIGRRLTSVTVDEVDMGHLTAELLDQMRCGRLPLEHDAVHPVSLGVSAGETLASPRHAAAERVLKTADRS